MNIEKTAGKCVLPISDECIRFPFLKCGDEVIKEGGDYKFEGIIVAVFSKLNESNHRVVVENSAGILHIFNPTQLKKV